MAGAEVSLGRLFIRFGIEDKDLKAGRTKTEKELRGLEKRVQQTQQRITQTLGRVAPWLGISGAILGIGRAFVSMGRDARALEDLRMQSGMSVRALYELREMVNQTGGSMQDLTTATTAFNNAILTASRDSQSEAAQAFRLLGVSIRDANGELTTLDQATEQMAKRFAGWTDGANEAAIASTVFGGGATAMLRALNQGEEGLKRAQRQAAKYGQDIETVHQQQLEWVRLSNELSTALTNLRDRAITPLIPKVIEIVDWVSKAAEKFGQWWQNARKADLQGWIKKVTDETIRGEEAMNGLARTMEQIRQEGRSGSEAYRLLDEQFNKIGATVEANKKKLEEWNAQLAQALLAGKELKGGIFDDGSGTNKPKTTQPGRTQSGLSPDQQRQLKGMLDQVSLLNQQLNGLPTKLGLISEINTNTYDQMQQKVTETIDTINRKYKDQEDTVRNLHQLKLQLAREEQDVAMQTADMVGSAISSMFSKSKAAAMAETIIHTATAVMRALRDVPWPYNLVQAAAIAAQGAAQLAKIRSTTEKGGGGSAGGIAASAPQSAPTQHALHVQGVDRASLYTGAVVENIIEAINEKVQQGVTLISTRNVPV